jgi:hypothetical protein
VSYVTCKLQLLIQFSLTSCVFSCCDVRYETEKITQRTFALTNGINTEMVSTYGVKRNKLGNMYSATILIHSSQSVEEILILKRILLVKLVVHFTTLFSN